MKTYSREQLLSSYEKILHLVLTGGLAYSENKLRSEFRSYKNFRLIQACCAVPVIFFGGLVLVGVKDPILFVMFGVFTMMPVLHSISASRFESLARQYLGGRLENSAKQSSTAEELNKLNDLKMRGVLTEEEFNSLKKKVI